MTDIELVQKAKHDISGELRTRISKSTAKRLLVQSEAQRIYEDPNFNYADMLLPPNVAQ